MEDPEASVTPAPHQVAGVPKSQASIDEATAAIGIACNTPMMGTTVVAGTSVDSPPPAVHTPMDSAEHQALPVSPPDTNFTAEEEGDEEEGDEEGWEGEEEEVGVDSGVTGGGGEEVEEDEGGLDIDLCRTVVEVVQPTSDDVCSICLDEFTEEDPGKRTACNHFYHLQCIMQWAQRSRECPLCFRGLQLAEEELNELLPFGEYTPPPAPGQSSPAQGGVYGLSAWELVLLQMAQAGLDGGQGAARNHRGHRSGHHHRSGRGHREGEREGETTEERRARRERERARERREANREREAAVERELEASRERRQHVRNTGGLDEQGRYLRNSTSRIPDPSNSGVGGRQQRATYHHSSAPLSRGAASRANTTGAGSSSDPNAPSNFDMKSASGMLRSGLLAASTKIKKLWARSDAGAGGSGSDNRAGRR